MAGTPSATGWLLRLTVFADACVDRLNPVTLRLLRQQLRSMVFSLFFCVLLTLGVVAAVVAATIAPPNAESPGVSLLNLPVLRGELLFLLVIALWSAMAWIAQPVSFIATVRQEREESTWDLLDLTGLPPLRIMAGLAGAAAIQQLLLMTVMAPFLVMAWMLSGVDPLAILLALVAVPLHGVVSVCVGIKTTITSKRGGVAGRPGRAAIGASLGWLFTMYLLWFSTANHSFFPWVPNLRAITPSTAVTALLLSNLALHFGASALVDAAMRMTHPALDRSTAPRFMTIAFILNLLLVVGALLLGGWVSLATALAWFALGTALWTAFFGVDALSEPFDHSPRQATICAAHSPWYRFWFAPGAAAARRFYLTLSGVALVPGICGWFAGYRQLDGSGSIAAVSVGVIAYAALVLMIADTAARGELGILAYRPLRHRRLVWGMVLGGTLAGGLMASMTSWSAVLGSVSPLLGLIPFGMAGAGVYNRDAPVAVMLITFAGFFALVAMAQQAVRQPQIRSVRGESV